MATPQPEPHSNRSCEQQTFSVVHAADSGRVYCLGAQTEAGVLMVWLDPGTARPVFGCFLDLDDAIQQLSRKLGTYVPLELVMHGADENTEDTNLEHFYDEVLLVKVVIRPRT